MKGINLKTGKCKYYDFLDNHFGLYYEGGYLYIRKEICDESGAWTSHIYRLDVQTGEKTLVEKDGDLNIAIYDGYMYEICIKDLPDNGQKRTIIKIYDLKTNDSVQHVLGDFELAVAQRTEKVGDDIIVELYIFNGEHCLYK